MTADDLFRLLSYLLNSYPALTERTSRQFQTLPTLEFTTANSNPMVFNMPGVNGLKTGNTNRAGYCLASSLPVMLGSEMHTVLLIVLGAESAALRNQVSHILLRHALQHYLARGFAG